MMCAGSKSQRQDENQINKTQNHDQSLTTTTVELPVLNCIFWKE